MNRSESIIELAKALSKAQLNIGNAHKDTSNPFYKSKYADLTSVMDACGKSLNNEGISVIQLNGQDELGSYVETMLLHNSGEFMSSKIHLRIGKNDMQGLGSAITYARRYGLQSMAFVGAEDDDGNETTDQTKGKKKKQEQPKREQPKQEQPKPVKLEEKYVKDLEDLIKISGVPMGDIVNFLNSQNLESLYDLNLNGYGALRDNLQTKINTKNAKNKQELDKKTSFILESAVDPTKGIND